MSSPLWKGLLVPEPSPLQRLRQLAGDPFTPARPLAFPSPHQRPAFAASFSQLRFWRLDQHSDGTACAIPDALHLRGELQPGALRWALDRLVERHEPLRSSYLPGGEDLLQVVNPAQEVDLPLEALPQGQAPEPLRARLQQELERPFDLAHGPLLRGLLLQAGHHDHVLLLVFHYSAFDGWSRTVLYRDLAALYGAALHGGSNPLPNLPLRYVDYASWERRSLGSAQRGTLLSHWTAALDELPLPVLPTDRDRQVGSPSSYRGCSAYFELEAPLAAAFETLCRSAAATLTMGLLTLVAVLLHDHSGQEDIGIGMPLAGRRHPSLEPLMGSFVNLMVIRVRIGAPTSFHRLLHRVRASFLRGLDHQALPFVMLEEALWPRQPPHAHVPVVVQLIDRPWCPALQGLAVRRLLSPSQRARHALEFRFRHRPSGALQTKIIYATDHFSEHGIATLFERLKILLGDLLYEPEAAIKHHG